VVWLPKNGINSGWPGVKNYVGALASFNIAHGGKDPREENPELWSVVRKRFKQNIQVVRTHKKKFAIKGSYIYALCMLAVDDLTDAAVAAAASDSLMHYSAVRVGHVSPKTKASLDHVLCWHHLEFFPSVASCQYIFIHVPSTKSRPGTELRPFWTAVGQVTSAPLTCPVRWMSLHFERNFRGDPTAPIFVGRDGLSIGRTSFQQALQLRLELAVRSYLPEHGFDVRHFTGISFRKGGITALSRAAAEHKILVNQVADFADHQDIQTTRRYDEASVASRATFSDVIGSGIISAWAAFEHA
jgi:hypothetical protein